MSENIAKDKMRDKVSDKVRDSGDVDAPGPDAPSPDAPSPDAPNPHAHALPATPDRKERRRALLSAIGITLLLPVATTLVGNIGAASGLFSTLFSAMGVWICVLLCGLILRRDGLSWRDVGLSAPDSWRQSFAATGLVIITAFLVLPLLAAGLSALGLPEPDVSFFSSILAGNTALYIPFMIFVVWGSAGIGEELLARGFLINRFETVFAGTRRPWLMASLAQAVLFGFAHFYQGASGIIITGSIGFMLALAYQFTGRNLIACILAHGLIDTISITSLYLS